MIGDYNPILLVTVYLQSHRVLLTLQHFELVIAQAVADPCSWKSKLTKLIRNI